MAGQSVAPEAVESTAAKLATHEAVCALRYQGILDRLARMEKVFIGAAGSLVAGLVVAVWQLSHLAGK